MVNKDMPNQFFNDVLQDLYMLDRVASRLHDPNGVAIRQAYDRLAEELRIDFHPKKYLHMAENLETLLSEPISEHNQGMLDAYHETGWLLDNDFTGAQRLQLMRDRLPAQQSQPILH